VLVDGRPIRSLGVPHRGIVHGDARCFSIACASIVAKVTRDRLMARLAKRYPAFHWERNCGYTTPSHVVALVEHGVTPHHRRSFVVKALTADLSGVEGAHGALDLDELADVVTDELQLPSAPLAADEPSVDGTLLETQITSDLQREIDSALGDAGT
jgi:ribonuclease HII